MIIRTRFTTLVFATIAAITLSSTQATAQSYVEIGVSALADGTDSSVYIRGAFRAIFDTSMQPEQMIDDSLMYYAAEAHLLDIHWTTNVGSLMSNRDIEDQHTWITDGVIGTMRVFPNGSVIINVNSALNKLDIKYSMSATLGPLTDPDMTLSDDPAEYILDAQAASISARVTMSPTSILWSTEGFEGGTFRAWAKSSAPTTPECLVDLNNDGDLDFLDIIAFLTHFRNGCP